MQTAIALIQKSWSSKTIEQCYQRPERLWYSFQAQHSE